MTAKLQDRVHPTTKPTEQDISQVRLDEVDFAQSPTIRDNEILHFSAHHRTNDTTRSLSNEEALRRVLDITKTYETSDTQQLLQIVGATGVGAETKALALSSIAKEGDRTVVSEAQRKDPQDVPREAASQTLRKSGGIRQRRFVRQ